jgi:transcriptional regulator with XRE-family HTH domain
MRCEVLFAIGRSIREARKRQKITQFETAKAAGIGRSSLSQIENGTIQDIGIRKMIRVMDFLGIELTTRPKGAPPTLEELQQEIGDSH